MHRIVDLLIPLYIPLVVYVITRVNTYFLNVLKCGICCRGIEVYVSDEWGGDTFGSQGLMDGSEVRCYAFVLRRVTQVFSSSRDDALGLCHCRLGIKGRGCSH